MECFTGGPKIITKKLWKYAQYSCWFPYKRISMIEYSYTLIQILINFKAERKMKFRRDELLIFSIIRIIVPIKIKNRDLIFGRVLFNFNICKRNRLENAVNGVIIKILWSGRHYYMCDIPQLEPTENSFLLQRMLAIANLKKSVANIIRKM